MSPDPRRAVEARALAAIAVMSVRRLPTFADLQMELHGVSVAELTRALEALVRKGRIVAEATPSEAAPLFDPPTVRYRPVALVRASSLPLPASGDAGPVDPKAGA